MFNSRLRWFAVILAALATAIVARLIDVQIVNASQYGAYVDELMTRPVRMLRAARGPILDRTGRPISVDVPAYDICVHFSVLTGESQRYLRMSARDLRRRGLAEGRSTDELVSDLRVGVAESWQTLSRLTGRPVSEFVEIGEQFASRVARIRAVVAERSGEERPVAEENAFHPVVEGIDDELALQARLELERYPWIAVVPGTRRSVVHAESLVHLLGRTGSAPRERIDADPLYDDPLRRLVPGDLCGISGIERAAELVLRGARGRMVQNLQGEIIEHQQPVVGGGVRLTIDLDLQQRVLELLAAGVEESENPAGGAAVVLDAQTREVLALVSYPVPPVQPTAAEYAALLRDTRRMPLRFRAVSDHHAPGSTCKAITLIAGLSEGVVSENSRIHCRGHYLPSQPNQFRCWIYNQHQTTHDAEFPAGQTAEDAIRNSCNIYFFQVGERLGPARLCDWFGRWGLGRLQGTGLIEEASGIVPTEAYLQGVQQRGYQTADAWNYSIGQGEVTSTPLQAANVAATAATGRWSPVKLILDEDGGPLFGVAESGDRFDESALRALRAGMWRVVNETGGTGARARLSSRDLELCGKTGSAQAVARVITQRFFLEFPDGRREERVAATVQDALAEFGDHPPRVVGWRAAERFPPWEPGEPMPSHAWFIGYTQPKGTPRGAAPRGRCYAISVLVEFGGSGGRVAGPIARQIAEVLAERR